LEQAGFQRTNASHYFGPFYSVGTSLFGLRVYSGATEVWKAKMELVEKTGNLPESTFDQIGERFDQIIIIKKHTIELGGIEYQLIDTTQENQSFVKSVVSSLR
jgi:hypothetical protein